MNQVLLVLGVAGVVRVAGLGVCSVAGGVGCLLVVALGPGASPACVGTAGIMIRDGFYATLENHPFRFILFHFISFTGRFPSFHPNRLLS